MSTVAPFASEGNHPAFTRTHALPDEAFLPDSHTPEEIASMAIGLHDYHVDQCCQTADESHTAAMEGERQLLIALLGTSEVTIARTEAVGQSGTTFYYLAAARGCGAMAETLPGVLEKLHAELAKARAVAVA